MHHARMRRYVIAFCLSFLSFLPLLAQDISVDDPRLEKLPEIFARLSPQGLSNGPVKAKRAFVSGRMLTIHLNDNGLNYPYRSRRLQDLTREIRTLFTEDGVDIDVVRLYVQGQPVENLIPQAFGGTLKRKKWGEVYPKGIVPLVRHSNAIYTPTKGLNGRHIAFWQSHGLYYANGLQRWQWQRSKLNLTVEDLFTQSYVLPYIVPMLENSGAIVLLPRERDISTHEYIIDNDPSTLTKGTFKTLGKDKNNWARAEKGFGYTKEFFQDSDNPFRMGTSLKVPTTTGEATALARWTPKIEVSDTYSVYVSYTTLANSSEDAEYTIVHAGGKEVFKVNQKMGGGTWIYLGSFPFTKGSANEGVTLSNHSSRTGQVVTADAVKIGGGMGNVRRSSTKRISGRKKRRTVTKPYEASGYPRYCEAARYWLQWAGIPDSVYAPSKGTDDYKDDYRCRGIWVNYLAGGTPANPTVAGLNIPLDLSFALHSDAGEKPGNDIVGTLAIYSTDRNDGVYRCGLSRTMARDLADIVQSYVVRDARTIAPEWVRRGMWDKQYSEAALPQVPSLLLELLSHQNFADMRYGLDPYFRFTLSRAIYKGILRYLCHEYGLPYVVQPLPVQGLSMDMDPDGRRVKLTWQGVLDPSEPSASPSGYILYTAVGGDSAPFDRGVPVFDNRVIIDLKPGEVYRFKVVAFNEGGLSFPSETLAAGRAKDSKGRVMVVNAFDKTSCPDVYTTADGKMSGFKATGEVGVPYCRDISYCATRRGDVDPDSDEAHEALGYPRQEVGVRAGNTFDLVALHGSSFLDRGYSFVSTSRLALEADPDLLRRYDVVDLLLGKQKSHTRGPADGRDTLYRVFSPSLQFAIESYLRGGGSLLASGAYVGSDMFRDGSEGSRRDREFAREVLKYRLEKSAVPSDGELTLTSKGHSSKSLVHSLRPSAQQYSLLDPDAISPSSPEGTRVILSYARSGLPAGVLYLGQYNSCVLSVPLETMRSPQMRADILEDILTAFRSNRTTPLPQ